MCVTREDLKEESVQLAREVRTKAGATERKPEWGRRLGGEPPGRGRQTTPPGDGDEHLHEWV